MKITNFALEKWYIEYEFKSKYNLSASGIKPLNFNDLIDIDELKDISLTYSPAQGDDKLVELIAKKNNVDKSEVLVTNGAIEALFLTQLTLFNNKDCVIVQRPIYPALYQIVEDLGANIINWRLDFNNDFIPDLNRLEKLMIENNPKALIINFPNNPTGANINQDDKNIIIDLCKKFDCYLISDEVYSQLNLLNTGSFKEYDKKITIDSLSKIYGLAGLRIGWIIANKEIIQNIMSSRLYTTLCNNSLSQKIAINILTNSDKYINNNLKLLEKNREITLNYLDKLKKLGFLDYVYPMSGLTIFVKLNITDDAEQFCKNFEEETSILLLPGNKYENTEYNNFFRLGFGIETKTLEYCLIQLHDYILKNY